MSVLIPVGEYDDNLCVILKLFGSLDITTVLFAEF